MRSEDLEREHTLRTAVARYDELRAADTFVDDADGRGLSAAEALEMLALGELIIRMAGYGRQLGVRNARRAGASWSQIGEALGTTKQGAWDNHQRWRQEQDR